MLSKTRSLITGKLWKPKNPYTVEYLKYLHTQLLKNQVVDDSNVDMIIEVLRSTAELLIWGDQNDSAMFDFFFEKQMLAFFIRYMKQRQVARQFHVQLLQTLSILLENIRSQTTSYYLMSNNYLNAVITYRFDFTDEECMAYFITLLKTLSLKLDRDTVNFFFNEKTQSFPLYIESLRFLDHPESMVRIAVRNITLNVFRTDNAAMQKYIRERTGNRFFAALTACMIRYVRDCNVAYRTLHNMQLVANEESRAAHSKSDTPEASVTKGSDTRRSESPAKHALESVPSLTSESPARTPHRSNTVMQLDAIPLSEANRASSLTNLTLSNSSATEPVKQTVHDRRSSPSAESTPDLSAASGSSQSPLVRMNQLRGRLTDLLQEHADQLHYVNDVLTMHAAGLNTLLARLLLDRLINAVYLSALVRLNDPTGLTAQPHTSVATSVCNSTSSTSSSSVATNAANTSGRHSAATSPTEHRKDFDPESRSHTASSADSRSVLSRNGSSDNHFTHSYSAAESRQRFVAAGASASASASASIVEEDDPLVAVARSVNEHAVHMEPQLAIFLVSHLLATVEHEEVADPLIEAFFCSLSTVKALVQRSPSRHASGSASSSNSDTDAAVASEPQTDSDAEPVAAGVTDTNVTDEEKLLKLRRSRFEHSCSSRCCLLQVLILECCDLQQRRGDQAALFLLCLLFALLRSARLRSKFLSLLNLHTVSLGNSRADSDSDTRSSSSFMMSLRVWLFDKLLTLIQQACVAEPRVRALTFELAVSVTRLLVLDSQNASDTNAIRTAFESFYAVLRVSLRNVAKNDELFLDMFEFEYEQFKQQRSRQLGSDGILTRAAFDQIYLNDTEVLLPCMSTPVCGLAAHKRLPSGVDEQRRHSLRVLFRLRHELLNLAQLTESDLPLLHAEIEQRQFRISEKLDLDKRDLVAVDMTENGQQASTKSYFLTFDKFQFLLVEPDVQRIGWGVVRFVGRLQDTEIAAQKHDSRCLDVLVQRPFSASVQQQRLFSFRCSVSAPPLLAATFRFEDYIRCLAAKQRFSKARLKIRQAKSRLIVKLLDARLIADANTSKRKRTAAATATASTRSARAYPTQPSNENDTAELDTLDESVQSEKSDLTLTLNPLDDAKTQVDSTCDELQHSVADNDQTVTDADEQLSSDNADTQSLAAVTANESD